MLQIIRIALGALLVVALGAGSASAALKKYQIKVFQISQFESTSPRVTYRAFGPGGFAVMDESGSNPVLKKMKNIYASTTTVIAPSLSGGFIFLRTQIREGPANNIQGTGASSSTIQWNTLTGWTSTGGNWCNANPTYICTLANRVQEETTDPVLYSNFLDVGPWVFHGTGWTDSDGYIARTATTGNNGNLYRYWRGSERQDGTVPALPLLGVGAVGLSVFALALSSFRGRRSS